MLGFNPQLTQSLDDAAHEPRRRFPLGRAVAGLMLLAMTGFAASLVAFAPV